LFLPGDDLVAAIGEAADAAGLSLRDGVLVVCQKVVSKTEGRVVPLAEVKPSPLALEIAAEHDKDPRQVELVLRESVRIVRRGNGVLITETRHGFVCANSGVDLSNASAPDSAVLLPVDPDASAEALRAGLCTRGSGPLAVIVSDTFGRPWREGLVDLAIGCAGIEVFADARGSSDLVGRGLDVTNMATVDQVAAAAGLLMTQASGHAAVWVTGVAPEGRGTVRELVRAPAEDLFR
jgi:coenzyme F420-0:L-glutamate ligase/coenzyme F420-1:gamma-L-glutamate ligase